MAVRPNEKISSALSKHGYRQIRKVGEGSFGAAILVQHERDQGRAIIKMIDIGRASKGEREDALKESQVLSSLKHPYIVRYRENFLEDGWLCIVMDYCEGGDLSERIKKNKAQNKAFPEEQVLRWFTQAILALKYIHDKHILHRDLKAGNFFLSKAGNLKMGDFGIAKVLECTAAQAQTQIGTPYYLSPEICQGKAYSFTSDIWSMGVILYEMCARRVPFEAPDLKTLIQRITRGPTPEAPQGYSPKLRELCRDLLNRDPQARPLAADILKKPLVQDMVKRMLEEVKVEEAAADARPSRSSAASAAPSAPSAPSVPSVSSPSYARGDAVEYYSETHGEWLPATITNVDPSSGRIMLNVKPNVWLSADVQEKRVRPRGAGASSGSGAPKSAGRPPLAGGAAPPNGGSPSRPSEQRRPESGGMRAVRSGSRDVPRDAHQRQPSGGPGREPSPMRVASPLNRRPGPSSRQSSPLRAAGVPAARGAPGSQR